MSTSAVPTTPKSSFPCQVGIVLSFLRPNAYLTRRKFLAEYRNEDCQQSEQQKENVYYLLSAHQGNGKRWSFESDALIVICHQLAKNRHCTQNA